METENIDGIIEIKDDEVNVVEIMRQIRENIRRRQTGIGSEYVQGDAEINADGGLTFDLEEAIIWHDKIYVDDQLRLPRTPLDRVLNRVRRPLHDLVRFYVNRMCDKQVMVNHHVTKAIGVVTSELAHQRDFAEEARRLREEVQGLRRQVEELQKCLERS